MQLYKCHLETLTREASILIRMVVTRLSKMNSISLIIFAVKQALTSMRIIIFGTTLKLKVYSFPRLFGDDSP